MRLNQIHFINDNLVWVRKLDLDSSDWLSEISLLSAFFSISAAFFVTFTLFSRFEEISLFLSSAVSRCDRLV